MTSDFVFLGNHNRINGKYPFTHKHIVFICKQHFIFLTFKIIKARKFRYKGKGRFHYWAIIHIRAIISLLSHNHYFHFCTFQFFNISESTIHAFFLSFFFFNTCFLQGHNHGLEKSSWSLEAEVPGLDYVACQFLVPQPWAGPFILHFSFSICRMRQTLNSQRILVKWRGVVQEVPGLCGLSGCAFHCLMSSLCMCFLLPDVKGNDHLLYKMSPYFLWLAIENVHTGSWD